MLCLRGERLFSLLFVGFYRGDLAAKRAWLLSAEGVSDSLGEPVLG